MSKPKKSRPKRRFNPERPAVVRSNLRSTFDEYLQRNVSGRLEGGDIEARPLFNLEVLELACTGVACEIRDVEENLYKIFTHWFSIFPENSIDEKDSFAGTNDKDELQRVELSKLIDGNLNYLLELNSELLYLRACLADGINKENKRRVEIGNEVGQVLELSEGLDAEDQLKGLLLEYVEDAAAENGLIFGSK